ncbi:hypothetical protein NL676_037395 [Syzygium grande]|nr:hypothetical protein NL676_037395 [Syzygium grande]
MRWRGSICIRSGRANAVPIHEGCQAGRSRPQRQTPYVKIHTPLTHRVHSKPAIRCLGELTDLLGRHQFRTLGHDKLSRRAPPPRSPGLVVGRPSSAASALTSPI